MVFSAGAFCFYFDAQLIHVAEGALDVDCAALYRACQLAQASEEGLIHPPLARGSGLIQLGGGVEVGLTVALLDSWQLLFPAGDYVARVGGGNLVGGPGGDPIAYSPGVQVLLIQSAAATVVNVNGGMAIEQALDRYGAAKAADLAPIRRNTDLIPAAL